MGSGNFFSGLLQGFGGAFHEHRQRQYEREQQETSNRFNYVSSLLKDPYLDPEAKKQIMADFGTMMSKSAGKEGKQAFQHIQNLVSMGLPTGEMRTSETIPSGAEAASKPQMKMKQEGLPIAESPASGPTGNSYPSMPVAEGDLSSTVPTEMPIKPRMKMKSIYRSPDEIRQERAKDIYSDEDAQIRARMPLEIQKEQASLHKLQVTNQFKRESQQLADEAKATLDVRKHLNSKIAQFKAENDGREPTEAEKVQLSGEAEREIEETAKAKLQDARERISLTRERMQTDRERLKGYLANINSMIENRNISVSQRQQALGLRGLAIKAQALESQIARDYAEFDTHARVRGTTKYADVARDAENRMKAIEDEVNQYRETLSSLTSELPDEAAPPTSTRPRMTKKTDSGRPYKIISNDGGKTKYKYYGKKSDGSPDMERIP